MSNPKDILTMRLIKKKMGENVKFFLRRIEIKGYEIGQKPSLNLDEKYDLVIVVGIKKKYRLLKYFQYEKTSKSPCLPAGRFYVN